jgi:RNA processing factor Prp31
MMKLISKACGLERLTNQPGSRIEVVNKWNLKFNHLKQKNYPKLVG